MRPNPLMPSRHSAAVLAAALLASACASVDLGPRYDPPPVRVPQPLPPPQAPLLLQLAQQGATPTLRISDWGPGVSAEMQARLTEPFVSGNLRDGSGLGLAICHSIVTALGARLSLHNRLHQGLVQGFDAVVEFRPSALPIAEDAPH